MRIFGKSSTICRKVFGKYVCHVLVSGATPRLTFEELRVRIIQEYLDSHKSYMVYALQKHKEEKMDQKKAIAAELAKNIAKMGGHCLKKTN